MPNMKDGFILNLFKEQKSYIVEYELGDGYYLFIEALDKYGGTLTHNDFDEKLLTDNICVELLRRDEIE